MPERLDDLSTSETVSIFEHRTGKPTLADEDFADNFLISQADWNQHGHEVDAWIESRGVDAIGSFCLHGLRDAVSSQSSVRNGEAGRLSLLYRLQRGAFAQP